MKKEELMNSRPTMLLSEFAKPERGMLIGFKAFRNEDKITAAYPIWAIYGNEVQFVLYFQQGTGKPVIDNTWLNSSEPPYINVEPFKVEYDAKNPTTFQDEMTNFFTIPKKH